ncbi:DUF3006 domain-containing protein [Cohnella soli]|uniref:DUF3006 domain-containing protein n=1 Tax=Cohnella soli TaxID=425005 RepID=A0ABW0HRV8_9BACL
MEHGVIDRFEEDIAVIEFSGVTRDFARSELPSEARPGDAIVLDNGVIRIDKGGTAERRKEIDRLMDELFE